MSVGNETSSSGAPPAVEAAAIDDRGGGARYPMFAVRELSSEGAFLACELLLENGEELTIELSRSGEPALRVRARVVELSRAPGAGMKVAFCGLDSKARERLERLASPPGEPQPVR